MGAQWKTKIKETTAAAKGRIFTNLLEADAQDAVPEVLLACCTPAQIPALTADLTRFCENLAERGRREANVEFHRCRSQVTKDDFAGKSAFGK